MVYQSQLQRNTGVVDPLVFSKNITDSYWHYFGYRTVKNFYKYYKDITPTNSSLIWGGQTEFQLPIIADKCGNWYLNFQVSALTATSNIFGSGGSTSTHAPRFVDWLGYYAWRKIQFDYGSNDVYTLYPDECLLRAKQSQRIEQLDATKELVRGERTASTREALATAVQNFTVDLPFPHTRGTSRWLELMQLAVQPRVTICWQPLTNVVQMGGAVGPINTINTCSLTTTYVHLDGDERDDNSARTEDPDGILRLFEELRYEQFTNEVQNGVLGLQDITIKLNNFRTSTKSVIILFRNLADVIPAGGADADYTNFQPLTQYFLEASDGRIFEPVQDRFARFILWPLYHVGPAGSYIYEWSFAMEPDDTLNASGSLNLGSTANLVLKIQVPATLTQNMQLTVIAKEFNTHQHANGDLIKNFK